MNLTNAMLADEQILVDLEAKYDNLKAQLEEVRTKKTELERKKLLDKIRAQLDNLAMEIEEANFLYPELFWRAYNTAYVRGDELEIAIHTTEQ